jgi:hypothetical protein
MILMPDPTEVPLTLMSSPISSPGQGYPNSVCIGDKKYGPPSYQDNSYWFSVYDRNTLAQVYSVVQVKDADTVPADLAGKYNTPQYFLAVTTRTLQTPYVPAGKLFTFLVDNGASVALKRLTQIFQQIGSGNLVIMNYAMAGVLGPGQPTNPAVEASVPGAVATPLILTATLVGVKVGTGMLYTPYPLMKPAP